MLRYDIIQSKALLKRFCRDYNVPVASLDPRFFEDQLETVALYKSTYRNAFDLFAEELLRFNSEEKYFEYYNQIKDAAIKQIQGSSEFAEFSLRDFRPSKFPRRELYSEQNHLRDFISIDLRKANFSILKLYCPKLFKDLSWEQFLKSFGASDYICNSKYIRQVIFGACNPKKQVQAQSELMSDIAEYLASLGYSIYSVVTDEIIIEVFPDTPHLNSAFNVSDILKEKFPKLSEFLKVECFNLSKNLQGYEKFIVASSDAVKCHSEFKCIDSDVFCQVIKYYLHKPIVASDLMFDYKDTTATFIDPIPNPFIDDFLGG